MCLQRPPRPSLVDLDVKSATVLRFGPLQLVSVLVLVLDTHNPATQLGSFYLVSGPIITHRLRILYPVPSLFSPGAEAFSERNVRCNVKLTCVVIRFTVYCLRLFVPRFPDTRLPVLRF